MSVEPLDAIRIVMHNRHGPTGDAFIATKGAKTLGTTTFYGDWRTNGIAKSMLHRCAMGGKFWLFTYDTAIHIADVITSRVHHLGDPLQQLQRVNIFPLRVGVGKVFTNVTKCGSTQQCICHCMGNYISVTMSN
jgi:hypothetical protein